jgi:hypothetical protein
MKKWRKNRHAVPRQIGGVGPERGQKGGANRENGRQRAGQEPQEKNCSPAATPDDHDRGAARKSERGGIAGRPAPIREAFSRLPHPLSARAVAANAGDSRRGPELLP